MVVRKPQLASAGVRQLQRMVLLLVIVTCGVVLVLIGSSSNNHSSLDFSQFVEPDTLGEGWQKAYTKAESNHDNIQMRFFGEGTPEWIWVCRNQTCERTKPAKKLQQYNLNTCNMLCGTTKLWPKPTGPYDLSEETIPVKSDSFILKAAITPSPEVTDYLRNAFDIFKANLKALELGDTYNYRDMRKISDPDETYSVEVSVTINGNSDVRLRLDTDESYNLVVKRADEGLSVNIKANSYCGARHGLETLSQLIWFDDYLGTLLMLDSAEVQDAPKFNYRGLLLDTSRNFFPVSEIKRTIDAMAANKLNTFHWHITDSQSFPLKLKTVPALAKYGAYSAKAVYTTDDVSSIVDYAKIRGIRVLMEIDAPGHVGRAWSWGLLANFSTLAYCIDAEPWKSYCGEPPCGQLNPENPHVYDLIEKIYAEVIELTGVDDLFHLGGDEVKLNCWDRSIIKAHNSMELWKKFMHNALEALKRANGGKSPELTLMWSSHLTVAPHLQTFDAKHVGVQIWHSSLDAISRTVLDAGYRSVISNIDGWYLDCGFGSWRDDTRGHCPKYRKWKTVYNHRPWAEGPKWLIEGGMVCQWTETAGADGLDVRLWPRAAAAAERLWTDPDEGADEDVTWRLDVQRYRLIARGITPEPIMPRWCSQNPKAC